MTGWIKLHRKILDNPIVTKDAHYIAVWCYLLLNAAHEEHPVLFSGKKIMLQPGQLITGRKKISEKLSISESKVWRILNDFESEQQIERQTSNRNSLISILNWDKYQICEQQNEQQMDNWRTTDEQQMDNWRTTDEQQVNTNKNDKNIKNVNNNKKEKNEKNDKKSYIAETAEIIDYLNMVCGTHYKSTTEKTKSFIRARLNEGFMVEDFKTVIDKKSREWITDTKMSKFLRPETLFGTKFEQYLNQLDAEPTAGTFGEPKRGADGLTDWERMWKNA